MQPLERSARLKQEAEHVLRLAGLQEILRPYGKLYPTGSYLLNVMVYPDIDLYVTRLSLKQLFEIGASIAACELVSQVAYEPSDDPVLLPGGLYLKSRVRHGDWGRPWKIDLWSLVEEVIQARMSDMLHFRDKMNAGIRQQIIRYKLSILTGQKRTPKYSGYYIYKAFMDEGLTDFNQVSSYLHSCGIEVEEQG